VTPEPGIRLASVADLNDLTEREIELDDGRVNFLLRVASAAIQRYCKQHLAYVENDEYQVRGTWSNVLILPERPVVDVASITIPTVGTVQPEAYIVDDRGMVSWQAGPFLVDDLDLGGSWGGPGVILTVVYTHGFLVMPDEIVMAACLVVDRLITVPDAGSVEKETVGDYAVTYAKATNLVKSVAADLLSDYRPRSATART
jgi:hypothetical protein